MGRIADVNFGKQLRNRKVFTTDVIAVEQLSDVPPTHVPCYTGADIERYHLSWGNRACLIDRVAQCGGCWDDDKHAAKNKLLTRQIGRIPQFAIDESGMHCLNTIFVVNLRKGVCSPWTILGLLNSRLLAAFWLGRYYDQRRTFPKIKGTYLKLLPLPDFGKVTSTVTRSIELAVRTVMHEHRAMRQSTTQHAAEKVAREIKSVDRRIDRLVYELYGLTDSEIAIVEEAAAR